MSSFRESNPSLDSYWRSIILIGRNVASYKFALAKSLCELAENETTFISLDDLAKPFSKNICEHLNNQDKQGISSSSQFLDTCRKYNKQEITYEALISSTSRLGFVNVIDAFHVVNQKNISVRFFVDDRRDKKGITITDNLFKLKELFQFQNLSQETEARWKLVETAWSLNMNPALLEVVHDNNANR